MVSPDTFMDEDLARLSAHARLLFIGLWTIADREGRVEDRPGRIKASLFPYEADLDVASMLDSLAEPKSSVSGSFITRYDVEGRKFIQVTNFLKHQKPHPREAVSDIPAPRLTKGEPRQALGEPRKPVSVVESDSKSESDSEKVRGLHLDGKPLDEIPCMGCGRVGWLKQSQGRSGIAPGFWCNNRQGGGCGANWPLNHPEILSQMTSRGREAIEAMMPPEVKTKAEKVDDAFEEASRRIKERGVFLAKSGGAV